jgi:hypothetical protein
LGEVYSNPRLSKMLGLESELGVSMSLYTTREGCGAANSVGATILVECAC